MNRITNYKSILTSHMLATITRPLEKVGMAYHDPEVHKRAFKVSHTKVFIYEDSQLVGFGRAVSDGEYQGAIYDVAVLPEAQRMGDR